VADVRQRVVGFSFAVLVGLLSPLTAEAQQAGGIAGLVRDTSGAVLPGVTVEAASPALIEKVRSAATDDAGRYSLTDLRPGTYVVTFALSGFSSVKRDGIVLTAGFTATVNADLQVGTVSETITVSGASPLVDTQNSRQQTVVSTELLSALPTSSKSIANLATLIPGYTVAPDVGGSTGLYGANNTGQMHGKTGAKVGFDGLNTRAPMAGGTSPGYVPNPAAAEEVAIATGATLAESSQSLSINMIPKEGGNTFKSEFSGSYANGSMQADNLTDELRARGSTTGAKVLNFYDVSTTIGGPIKRDKLWFFAEGHALGIKNQLPGVYFNKTKGTAFYTPDLSQPAYFLEWLQSGGSRVTWQASNKNKVSVNFDVEGFFNRGRGRFESPEAYSAQFNLWPQWILQGTWNSPVTGKLLLEAGVSYTANRWPYPSPGDTNRPQFAALSTSDIAIRELSTGFVYNAKQYYLPQDDEPTGAERFTMSYITGTHAIKAGIQLEQLRSTTSIGTMPNQSVTYAFLRGVPNLILQYAPALETDQSRDLGLFVQDRWTIKRLTLNYGLRFEWLNGFVPAQDVPATRFLGERVFAPVHDIPNWTDLDPRIGVSYSLFGSGRTVVRASIGRYTEPTGVAMAQANNPLRTTTNVVTRTWTLTPAELAQMNATGQIPTPNCVLQNFNQNGACGPISDRNFGSSNPNATVFAPDVLAGLNSARGAMWDVSTEVQHELFQGVSVTGGWYRNWAVNFRAIHNTPTTPADFSPYCITAPIDARLPGGGGYQVCGMYDVSPSKFGQVANVVTQASDVAQPGNDVTCVTQPTAVFQVASGGGGGITVGAPASATCGRSNFFTVKVDTRIRQMRLGGGVDTGQTVNDACFVADNPQQLLNCHQVIPFSAQTQVKIYGSYPLPAGFSVSGTLQNLSGAPVEANYPAPNALIAPSLGRNLASCGTQTVCAATALVPLYAPWAHFEPRRTQLDMRLSKVVNLGSTARLQGNLEFYNLLNASDVLGVVSTYGPSWQTPTGVGQGAAAFMPGRALHVGGTLSF